MSRFDALRKRLGAAVAPRRGLLLTALVLVHVLIPVVTLLQPQFGHDRHALQSDAHRFQQIALTPGTPGRDFRVEYPPLAVLGMRALGQDGLAPLMQRLVWLNALADLVLALALWWAWSRRAALVYAVLCAPLLAFLMNGFDLVATAVAVAGLACTRRGRQVLGGALIGAAAFVKVWPALLVVVVLLWQHRRAVASALTTMVAGGVAWLAWSGLRGPLDVLTYRGARGWHVESTPGVLLALIRGAHARYEAGAWRVGAPPMVIGTLITLTTYGALAYWFWRARRLPEDAAGATMVGALGVVFFGATLLSPQYLIWAAPFAAIAGHRRQWRVVATYAVVMVMNCVYVGVTDLENADNFTAHLQVLARNAVILGLVLVCARELYCVSQARRASASTSTYGAPLTSTVTECSVPVNELGAA